VQGGRQAGWTGNAVLVFVDITEFDQHVAEAFARKAFLVVEGLFKLQGV